MKKFIVVICLAFLSVGAYASNDGNKKVENTPAQVAKKFLADYTYTSSCGEVWDVHTSEGLSGACHLALWQKMENACGTSIDTVGVEEGNDC